MSRTVTRTHRFVLLLLTIALCFSDAPAFALNQQQGTMSLIAQTPYVPADGEFVVVFSWDGPATLETSVVARVQQPLTSLAELAVPSDNVLTQTKPQPLFQLPRTPEGLFTLTIPVRSYQASDSPALYLPDKGVHPVSIELASEGSTVGRLETNLVRLPSDATSIDPVPVSIVLPVTQADGLASGLTVTDTTAVLNRHPALPISVQIGVGVLSQLAIDPQLTSDFRDALGDRSVIVSPELDLDPSALAEISQGELFTQSVETARTQTRDLGLMPATEVFPWDGTVTTAGVDLLGDLGINIILASSELTTSDGQLSGDQSTINVVQPNGEFSTQLNTGDDVVQRAHRVLAELALLTQIDRSPIVLGGDAFGRLDRRSLEILLDAWEGLSPVEPVTLEQAVAGLPLRGLRAAEQPQQDLTPLEGTINQINRRIDTYSSYYISGGTEPQQFETALISSLSRERNPDDRQLRVDQIAADIDAAFSPITIVGNQAFTLTTNRFALPLQLETNAPGPRQVLLRFQSDKINVYTDDTYSSDGDLFVVLEPGATTITINVEANTLGLSPVDVIVLTPDGQEQLATGSFAIRSTAIPGLGLLLSGAAGAFLVVWWLAHHRRERRTAGNDELASDSVTA